MWSIFDIIDGSKVYTFSLDYWKWSNASCYLMNIKYDQYKSVITFKKLSLPFLHFICFQTSRLLPFYKRSSTSIPAPSKGYISTTSILRNIQKDAIIMLCTECVLSSLIWVVYRKKWSCFLYFGQLYVNFWQFLLPLKLSIFLSYHLCRVFLNPHVFQIRSRDSIHISFIFIPLHKRATIDTYSSIKKNSFHALCFYNKFFFICNH